MASIRVNERLYSELNKMAGELGAQLGHPVSLEDVLEHLLTSKKLKFSDFAGSWNMSDNEAEGILRGLRESWGR